MILSGKINDDQEINERTTLLIKEAHWDLEEAQKILDAYQGCLLLNDTQGITWFNRVKGSLTNAIRYWVEECLLAKEPATGIKAIINDMTLDGDSRHAQYGQIAGMVFSALSIAMLNAEPHLFEPTNEITIKIPEQFKESVIMMISNRRGQISNVKSEGEMVEIKAIIPTAESFGLVDPIKNENQDLATFESIYLKFQKIPEDLEEGTIIAIRKRKGLPEELPSLKSWYFLIKNIDPQLKPMKNKIIATMEEQQIDTLQIPRTYLSEFLDQSVVDIHRNDLPRVSYMFESYLKDHDMKIQYDGSMIKFLKSNIIKPP